jgi:hypothetical protein
MDFALCKTCGERHRVTPRGCPKFRNKTVEAKSSRSGPKKTGLVPLQSAHPGSGLDSPKESAGVASGLREAKPKGRPLEKDRPMSLAQTRPWVSLGMSRRTYYRRKAEGKL